MYYSLQIYFNQNFGFERQKEKNCLPLVGNIISFSFLLSIFFFFCNFFPTVNVDKFHDGLRALLNNQIYHLLNKLYGLNMADTQKIQIQKWPVLLSLFILKKIKGLKKENIKPAPRSRKTLYLHKIPSIWITGLKNSL